MRAHASAIMAARLSRIEDLRRRIEARLPRLSWFHRIAVLVPARRILNAARAVIERADDNLDQVEDLLRGLDQTLAQHEAANGR